MSTTQKPTGTIAKINALSPQLDDILIDVSYLTVNSFHALHEVIDNALPSNKAPFNQRFKLLYSELKECEKTLGEVGDEIKRLVAIANAENVDPAIRTFDRIKTNVATYRSTRNAIGRLFVCEGQLQIAARELQTMKQLLQESKVYQ